MCSTRRFVTRLESIYYTFVYYKYFFEQICSKIWARGFLHHDIFWERPFDPPTWSAKMRVKIFFKKKFFFIANKKNISFTIFYSLFCIIVKR